MASPAPLTVFCQGIKRRCFTASQRSLISTISSKDETSIRNIPQSSLLINSKNRTYSHTTDHQKIQLWQTETITIPRNHQFSTLPKVDETETKTDQTTTSPPLPSFSSLQPDYTPGDVLSIIHRRYAGKKVVSLNAVHMLCQSSRSHCKKDAKVIRTVLVDCKRINSMILDVKGSELAMEGMLRSMLPKVEVMKEIMEKGNEEHNGKMRSGEWLGLKKVHASLFVLDCFLDIKSGLYFATKPETVDTIFTVLLEGLEEGKVLLKAKEDKEDGSEEGEAEEQQEEEKKIVRDLCIPGNKDIYKVAERSLYTTAQVISSLVRRQSNPENRMKKRAARKYKKQLRLNDGPKPDTTVHLAVQIVLKLHQDVGGGVKAARRFVVDPYLRKGTYYKLSEETIQLLAEAEAEEERLSNQKELVTEEEDMGSDATAAEEEEAGDIDDIHNNEDDSNGDAK